MHKPTKNFQSTLKKEAEAFLEYGYANKKKFNFITTFPCRSCRGVGRRREWTGIGSDYNEEKCLNCKGTGIITKEEFAPEYYRKIEEYEKRLRVYQEEKPKYLAAKSKLTPEEFRLLQKWTN
jgi:hypothetical protein